MLLTLRAKCDLVAIKALPQRVSIIPAGPFPQLLKQMRKLKFIGQELGDTEVLYSCVTK